jgi:predicted DNA-binding transcriptional regulator AlpA
LAALLRLGLRTIRSMDRAGKLPEPIRLSSGCVRWRYGEILDWLRAGAPCRQTWARIRAARK